MKATLIYKDGRVRVVDVDVPLAIFYLYVAPVLSARPYLPSDPVLEPSRPLRIAFARDFLFRHLIYREMT